MSCVAHHRILAAPSSLFLSQREYDVLCWVGNGVPTKEIAPTLGISSHTVNKYRERLCRKLHCHSTGELVLAAVRLGAVEVAVTPCVAEMYGKMQRWRMPT